MVKEIKYNREVILFHSIFNNCCVFYNNNEVCIHPKYHDTIFMNNNDIKVFTIFRHNLMKINGLKQFTLEFMVDELIKIYKTDNCTVSIV